MTTRLPGLLVAAVLGGMATVGGGWLPLLGGPVVAVVLGVALSPWARRRPCLRAGTETAATFVLQVAVVVLGAQLSLGQVASVGVSSFPVMAATLTSCLLAAWFVGRRLGIDSDLRTLVGVGTAICGASAIAAASPVIRAGRTAVSYAITTIFFFNIAAVLLFPPLGHLLGMSQSAFGLFAGTAVNDTSSVVATASSYGSAAADHAVVVKLVRSLVIIPVCLVLGALTRRREPEAQRRYADRTRSTAARSVPTVPWFLVGFLVVVAVNSTVAIPHALQTTLRHTSVLLIAVALAAIGTSTDLAALRKAGPRPLLLGAILWIVVSTTSLGLQAVA